MRHLFQSSAVVLTWGTNIVGGLMFQSPRVHADNDGGNGNGNSLNGNREEATKIQIGFQIAPVKLNLAGKDRDPVGLGSYIVNGADDSNGCHNGGGPPHFDYLAGADPYWGQRPKALDPEVYLAGGQDFGRAGGDPSSPQIVSRNLTPDKTGHPEGGHTFAEFPLQRKLMANFFKTCLGPIFNR